MHVKTHWYQVTNMGAGIDALGLDSSILFKYTIEMLTTQYVATTDMTYVELLLLFPDIVYCGCEDSCSSLRDGFLLACNGLTMLCTCSWRWLAGWLAVGDEP